MCENVKLNGAWLLVPALNDEVFRETCRTEGIGAAFKSSIPVAMPHKS
jgi:hypothetical protein